MIGSLYALLFAASEAPDVITPPANGGGWPTRSRTRTKRTKRDEWQDELDRLTQAAPEVIAPPVDTGTSARVASLQAAIVRAKNGQERAQRQAEAAIAERDAVLSQALIAQAVEAQRQAEADYMVAVQAEAVARRQLMDLDIAFVAAVLADM